MRASQLTSWTASQRSIVMIKYILRNNENNDAIFLAIAGMAGLIGLYDV
jgi:hypothetical protein